MSILTERTNPYGGNLSHRITFVDSDNFAIDITRQVLEFNIYESIFSQTLSADFVIRDALGLIDSGRSPMTGQEFVEIAFDSNNETLLGASPKLVFKIHRIANKKELTPGASVYSLHGASLELEQSIVREVGTSYKDKLGHEAIQDIFDNYLSLDNGKALKVVENCTNVVPYVSVGQSPLEAIACIASDCISEDYPEASHYLFYETTQGFNFRTLSNLLEQEPRRNTSYYFSDPAVKGSFPPERTIIGHTFLDNVDTIDLLQRGLYDNNVGIIDPIAKKFNENTFNYAKDFDKLPHITGGGYPTLNLDRNLLGQEIEKSGHKRFLIGDVAKLSGSDATFDGRITANNDPYIFHGRERYTKTPLVAAQLASLRQHGINISVPANLTINAGDVIQIFIPGHKDREGVDDSAFINHYGPNPTFLVTSIATKLTPNGDYISTMQCVKESFAVDLRGQKIQTLGAVGLNEVAGKAPNFFSQLAGILASPSDANIGLLAGTLSNINDEAVSEVADKATKEADKVLTDAATAEADPNAPGAADVATDAASQADTVADKLDTAADDIAAKSEELAKDAVKNIADAAVATGVALATSKIMTSINVSPAKIAKIVAVIKLLEKIPIFKGPITDVKADIAATKDQVTSTLPGGGD